MRKTFSVLTVLLLATFILNAQKSSLSLISTSGDYFESENMSLSWSLGEVMIESFSANSLYLAQGFQQSIDFSTDIKQNKTTDLGINIYPNPTSNFINIELAPEINISNRNIYHLSIIDINGKTVLRQKINQQVSNINISEYLSGLYFIKIINPNSNFQQTTIVQKIK